MGGMVFESTEVASQMACDERLTLIDSLATRQFAAIVGTQRTTGRHPEGAE